MDQIIEFFKGLDALQWILLAGGLFLLWPTISEKLGFSNKNVAPSVEPDAKPDHDLTSLVSKWECLADCCHEHELHKACAKLQEVFPMLVKPYEIHKPEPEPNNPQPSN